MSFTSVPYIAGHQKKPICQKCYEKVAVVICKKCGFFLCMDCRHNHVCNKSKKNEEKGKLPN